MIEGWKEFSIEDIAEIRNEIRIPLSKMERAQRQGEYPYYGASGIIDYVDDFLFEGPHVLISEDGENLKSRKTPIAFIADDKFWVNNHAHIVRGKSDFHNELICQYFSQFDLTPYITGAVQPKLNRGNLVSIPIYLPSGAAEQKAIAGVLSSLDDKIDLLHRQNKTLEALAETLFRQWFIEEAKDEWESGSVNDFADHKKETVKPAKNENMVFHHYSLPAFDSGKAPVEELGADIKSNKYAVPKNSILISKLNPRVSRVWSISDSAPENGICSTEFQVALPKKPEYFCFVYSLCKSHAMRSELTACASGTSGSHQRVNPADIFDYEFLRPPEDLIKKFSKLVMPKIQKTFNNQKQIQTLEKLRDTLIPKLMSGEVRVDYDREAA